MVSKLRVNTVQPKVKDNTGAGRLETAQLLHHSRGRAEQFPHGGNDFQVGYNKIGLHSGRTAIRTSDERAGYGPAFLINPQHLVLKMHGDTTFIETPAESMSQLVETARYIPEPEFHLYVGHEVHECG